MALCIQSTILFLVVILFLMFQKTYCILPTYTPAIKSNNLGRDALIKVYFRQGYVYKDIVSFLNILHGIQIGYEYLRHVIRRLGLRRKKPYTDADLDSVIQAIQDHRLGSGMAYWFCFACSNCKKK